VAKARKPVLLRLDPDVHDALARWAADELRSANAQIEFLLRRALATAGRLPKGVTSDASTLPRRGRPPKATEGDHAVDPGDGEPPPRPDPDEETS